MPDALTAFPDPDAPIRDWSKPLSARLDPPSASCWSSAAFETSLTTPLPDLPDRLDGHAPRSRRSKDIEPEPATPSRGRPLSTYTDAQKAVMTTMRDRGDRWADIAERFNCSISTARRAVLGREPR